MTSKRIPMGRRTWNTLAASMGLFVAASIAFFILAIPPEIFAALPFGALTQGLVASCGGLIGGFSTAAFLLPGERNASAPRPVRAGDEFGFPPFADMSDVPPFRPETFSAPEPAPVPVPVPVAVSEEVAQEEFGPDSSILTMSFVDIASADRPEDAVEDDAVPIFVDLATLRSASATFGSTHAETVEWVPLLEAACEPAGAEPEPVKPAIAPDPRPAPVPVAGRTDDSIDGLMHRLESGLEIRARAGIPPSRQPRIASRGTHLHDTLEELRRMASVR